MSIWPFGKKKRKEAKKTRTDVPTIMDEALDKMIRLQAKKIKPRPCPDLLKVNNACACIECPAKITCPVEESCRATGCEQHIRTCSLRQCLLGLPLSDYATDFVHSHIRQMMERLQRERMEGSGSLLEEYKKEEERKRKKREADDLEFNEPTVLG